MPATSWLRSQLTAEHAANRPPLLSPEIPCVRYHAIYMLRKEKKRNEKTTPFDVNLMRSQVLYRAAQGFTCLIQSAGLH